MEVFKGAILIHIREYYDDGGQEKPGKKGIALKTEQWRQLTSHINTLQARIEGENEEEVLLEIDTKLKASVSVFKGSHTYYSSCRTGIGFLSAGQRRVGIREYFLDDEGRARPGAKGISLTLAEWNALCSHVDAIDAAIAAASLEGVDQVHGEKDIKGATQQEATEKSLMKEDKFFSLGERRRVTISEFKGSLVVDIREYYDSSGGGGGVEMEKPGKKGISLSREEWQDLCKAKERLLLEAGGGGEEKSFQIGERMRRLTASTFKGTDACFNKREREDMDLSPLLNNR